MKLQLLMATYNGESYLRKQLDSIVEQTCFSDIEVLIRDDKSEDKTSQILKEYELRYGFKVIYGQSNIGVNKSMWHLISHADESCDLFAFCDQDDVWIKKKIENAFQMLKNKNKEEPILYVSKSRLVNAELEVIGDLPKPEKPCTFFNAIIQNIFPGHAMIFNKSLLRILKRSDISDAKMYDWWTYIAASAFGEIVYDERVGTLYRQHEDNAVGYQLGGWKLLKTRLKRMNKEGKNAIILQARSFYEQYVSNLPPKCRWELKRFLSAKTWWSRFWYVTKTRFYRQTKSETLAFKILYVLGKYKD